MWVTRVGRTTRPESADSTVVWLEFDDRSWRSKLSFEDKLSVNERVFDVEVFKPRRSRQELSAVARWDGWLLVADSFSTCRAAFAGAVCGLQLSEVSKIREKIFGVGLKSG